MYASTEQHNRERVQSLADWLYRERYHYLVRIAYRNGAGDDADDAVNDAFAAFIDKFDPASGSPPFGWLTLTLKRRCWAINRSRRLERRAGHWVHPESGEPRFSVAGVPTQTAGPEESAERTEYVLEARERLAALKPDERTAPAALRPRLQLPRDQRAARLVIYQDKPLDHRGAGGAAERPAH